ncbi:hypothetical protein [Natronospira bacteriovora]|uniref:Sulfotransferase domain-containing protein n=1 Tax=Natronospira bacteriovora TaxID=3069753 RepID=A0ABU0WB22_9GAMM|nr:hypothetical protein [Natronospira sp. AB-CW4]MDQ2070140.1 hypothetical protein [Natronospira sp. AB-CW4]
MPKPVIRFHLGAHKTATTYIQSRLRRNRSRLARHGIHFVDLWANEKTARRMRGWIRQVAWENRNGNRKKLVTALRDLVEQLPNGLEANNRKSIILSYENILGTYNLAQTPRLYDELERGLSILDEAFGIDNMEFFFSYRSMDRFIESCYLQCIHTQKETRHFDEWFADIDINALSWLDVLTRLSQSIGKERLSIWPYDAFRDRETAIWQALLGRERPNELLIRNASNLNPSLTKEAVECLRVANGLFKGTDARNLSRFLKENLSPDKGYSPARYLDEEQRDSIVRITAFDTGKLEKLASPLG